MSEKIGAFDAKAKLSQLLRNVEHGRSYTITVRGRPVADLVPHEPASRKDRETSVESMRSISKIQGVSDRLLEEMIAEGRK